MLLTHLDEMLAFTTKVVAKKKKVRDMQVQEVKRKATSMASLDEVHDHNLAASVYHHSNTKHKKIDMKDFSAVLQKEFEELKQMNIQVGDTDS